MPHDVTEQRPQLIKAVLDWLDRYPEADERVDEFLPVLDSSATRCVGLAWVGLRRLGVREGLQR